MTRHHTRWLEPMFLLAGTAVVLVASTQFARHRSASIAACSAALPALAWWYWGVRQADDEAARRTVAWLARIIVLLTVVVPLLQHVLAP